MLRKVYVVILISLFSVVLPAKPSSPLLTPAELSKLPKLERAYYQKKVALIFAKFEKIHNKGAKLQAGINWNILINEAYAANSNTCLVGGNIVARRGGKCSIRKYKCTPSGSSSKSGFRCGEIYGSACVAYKGLGISLACSKVKIDYNQHYASADKLYKNLCGSDSDRSRSNDGCKYLNEGLSAAGQAVKMATGLTKVLPKDSSQAEQTEKLISADSIETIIECSGKGSDSPNSKCELCFSIKRMREKVCTDKYSFHEADNIDQAIKMGLIKFSQLPSKRELDTYGSKIRGTSICNSAQRMREKNNLDKQKIETSMVSLKSIINSCPSTSTRASSASGTN